MDRRLQLQALLESVLGTRNVYFQPPADLTMNYPCIVYKRDSAVSDFANNRTYRHTKSYMVTVIDRDPDSEIPDKVLDFPTCIFKQHFTSNNLNHDVYSLYF